MSAAVLLLLALFSLASSDTRAECETLASRIAEAQVQKDTHYRFPNHWQKQKGLWPSSVHFNFAGNEMMATLRNKFEIYDNNVFTAIWITEMLIEADDLGVVKIDEKVINNALEAVVTYADKNFPGSGRQVFWPQKESNGTWIVFPQNLRNIGGDGQALLHIAAEIFRDIGLEKARAFVEQIAGIVDNMLAAFNIPADFDDTYCNLALGSMLKQSRFQSAYKTWAATYTDSALAQMVTATLEYTYRPRSANVNHNSIDPRTYYFMRDYFQTSVGSKDFMLPPTWIENVEQSSRLYTSGYSMPFDTNNIDASVLANVLLGMTQRYAAAPSDAQWLTPEVLSLYDNIGNYITWVIKDGPIVERTDLGLMYYPNLYAFFWFCSRTVEFLDQIQSYSKLPNEFEHIRQHLGAALHGQVTSYLIADQKRGKYWEQWLGNADTTATGGANKRGEDRIFATATALNTLYDIWAVKDEKGNLQWLPNTPSTVKAATANGAQYLEKYVNSQNQSLQNVFFSGSMKGMPQLPFSYPGNKVIMPNGTIALPSDVPMSSLTNDMAYVMSGVVGEDQYQEMVSQLHFGMYPTPVKFDGFNSLGPFPYWSCAPLTQAASLLALSRYAKLSGV